MGILAAVVRRPSHTPSQRINDVTESAVIAAGFVLSFSCRGFFVAGDVPAGFCKRIAD